MNLKFYFSNHFCHNGHNTIRYVKSGECLQCLKEKKPPLSEEEKKYEVLSRKEATHRGVEFYLSHHFCRNGHNRIRYVKNARCVQCVEDKKPMPKLTEQTILLKEKDKALRLELQGLRKRLKELQAEERKWKRK